ncbi:hypothetical protein HKD37_01G001059 [Glycine soja]
MVIETDKEFVPGLWCFLPATTLGNEHPSTASTLPQIHKPFSSKYICFMVGITTFSFKLSHCPLFSTSDSKLFGLPLSNPYSIKFDPSSLSNTSLSYVTARYYGGSGGASPRSPNDPRSRKSFDSDDDDKALDLSTLREINVSGDIQEVNDKTTNMKSDSVDLQLEHSSPHHITKSDSSVGEAITLGSSTQEGVTSDPQPEKRYTNCENINKTDALKKISCDNGNRENKKQLQCVIWLLQSDLQSNMFSTLEGKRSLKQPSSTIGTKGSSLGNEKNVDMLLGSITQARENFRSNDTKHGRKLVGDSLTDSSKLMRNAGVFLGSKDDLKSCSNTRALFLMSHHVQENWLGISNQFFYEVNKSKTTFLEIGISNEDVNLKLQDHSCPFKLKNFKVWCQVSFGANRVLTTSLHQKETNSLLSSGQSMDKWGITTSKNDHSIDNSDNQKSSTPFLKRKTIEVESMPNNLLYNHSTYALKSSPVIKVTKVEIHARSFHNDNRSRAAIC